MSNSAAPLQDHSHDVPVKPVEPAKAAAPTAVQCLRPDHAARQAADQALLRPAARPPRHLRGGVVISTTVQPTRQVTALWPAWACDSASPTVLEASTVAT